MFGHSLRQTACDLQGAAGSTFPAAVAAAVSTRPRANAAATLAASALAAAGAAAIVLRALLH